MAYFIPYLPSNERIETAINSEEDCVTVIRFGSTGEQNCFVMDETLDEIAGAIQKFAAIYKVDFNAVPDCKEIYGLDDDPITVLFFYKGKQISLDMGIGNKGKINYAIADKQEMVDIIQTVYRGASNNRPVMTSDDVEYRY